MANEKNLTEETTEVPTEGIAENTGEEGATEPEGIESPEDIAGEEVEDETEDSGSEVLVAVYPILFQSHQYKVGDTLPTNYPDMVDAWLKARTAVWRKVEVSIPKAEPVTAESGITGNDIASQNGENLVGKVPKTSGRKRK